MKVFHSDKLGSIRCKPNIRWQHLSQMKNVAHVMIRKNIFADDKCSRPSTTERAPMKAYFGWQDSNPRPFFFQKPAADIKGPLFSVLFNVLNHNWRHFFRSSAVRTLMGGGQSGNPDQVLHQRHFLGIMQAFGQSFLQPDIAIFKQNLEALDSLNTKWKLYQKVFLSGHLRLLRQFWC